MLRVFLLLIALGIFPARALVLEQMIAQGRLVSSLTHKNVCYYIGSFDPLHKGHEAIATLPPQRGLCDYTLVYPAFGGDAYKQRADVNLRLDMLFAAFAHHPAVIVTRLAPRELQIALTVANPLRTLKGKPTVKPAFQGTRFVGVIGADIAISLDARKDQLASFMEGIVIPAQYQAHTIGGIIALPVEKFIVVEREGSDLNPLRHKLGHRTIIATLKYPATHSLSSTAVKRAIRNGQSLTSLVSQNVADIIDKHKLYH